MIVTSLTTEHTVGRRGRTVFARFDGLGGPAYGMSWQRADAIALSLKSPTRELLGSLEVARLDMPGRTFLLPLELAAELGRELTAKARDAEEIEQAERTADDAAILIRAGAPFGLARHPKIKAEAAKRAAWSRRLRRYMPGGVRSKAVLGAPTVIVHQPQETPTP